MKLLFLDFDGVLHPTSGPEEEHFCRAELLAQAMTNSACQIVISSSWRHHHDRSYILSRLPRTLGQRVIGMTGGPCPGRWPRHQEILAYLGRNPKARSWRALDDSRNEFPPDCSQLIACDPNVGIGSSQITLLQKWLAFHDAR